MSRKKGKKKEERADRGEAERKFASFADLKRAQGGGEAAREASSAGADRGWTLETGDAAVDADVEGFADDVGGPDETMRQRIGARPPGFGPMDVGKTGPPMYADEESEEMEILRSFRVRTVFPDDVRREVAKLPKDPGTADFEGREDLRGETIFTIDGDDAKDFDDAIGIRRLPNGNLEVGVHIADVSHYVRPGTRLDDEALARGTSVYLADQVVPMLPEELSNELCSLVPKRDRLAYSVRMEFDGRGTRVAARVFKSVIKSVQRNTYRGVQALLDRKDVPEAREIAHLEEPLRLFEAWTKKQQQLRDARGSMRIQSRERKFVFDVEYKVEAIVEAPRWFSNTLIEETALAANQAVGDLFRKKGLPTLYRVHPEKDPDEIAAVAKMLAKHGIRVPAKDRLTGRDVGRLIRAARGRPNADALIRRIMGLVERAYYEVRDHEDVATHFGLAREAYLHFTSPIRRYPDLLVHRWLHAVESRGAEAEEELKADELVHDLNQIASHCSMQAEIAEMTEYAIADLKICQLVEPHVGERHEAVVEQVNRGGMSVRLTAFNVTAFLPARLLGDRIRVEGPTLTARAGRRSLSFTEGYPVRVRIQDVDFIKLQVLLELA